MILARHGNAVKLGQPILKATAITIIDDRGRREFQIEGIGFEFLNFKMRCDYYRQRTKYEGR